MLRLATEFNGKISTRFRASFVASNRNVWILLQFLRLRVVNLLTPFFAASLINWSLISLIDLVAFLLILYNVSQLGFHFRRRLLLLWPIIIFSVVAILFQVTYLVLWAIKPMSWIPDAWWTKLIGFMIVQSWNSPYAIYFLVIQLLVLLVALLDIYGKRHFLNTWQDSYWSRLISIVEHLGSHLRVASCLLLPAIQLVVGISHPSWASLPFFVGSCVGLVDWSLTSNFLGLFRWWRLLQLYASFNIFLLYTYQLPVEYPSMIQWMADLLGLYKISENTEWTKICSSLSLILYYIVMSFIKSDLEEMDFIISRTDCNLTEQLLPSKHSFFIRESRSGVRHTNVLLRGAVFRSFSINFFTYGFPVYIP
ncbi:hypothetical protein KIW84_064594 [Lathyrus oleraceus]|uniref:Piezo non-specific cation channel R-Ras-binding domain-containing protein n=1 Tax=Pisum sativum TaxID=3888 RepID=A0A9D4WD29_PEA|nr:hypothetical protein KIW84_064594 [Pisum sativum]